MMLHDNFIYSLYGILVIYIYKNINNTFNNIFNIVHIQNKYIEIHTFILKARTILCAG